MGHARKFLNHITIFSAVVTVSLVVANLVTDDVEAALSTRKINKLKSKLDCLNE